MRKFMDEDFLLSTDTAMELYHGAAEGMPIYDYHCHLDPRLIADNHAFSSLTELMLGGDHYKWRAMLSNGESEDMIRGDGDEKKKFLAFARTLRYAPGNPLLHWTQLELKRTFGIEEALTEENAEDIWELATDMLRAGNMNARDLIDKFNVDVLCTTDDPADDLCAHRAIAGETSFRARVLPAFRPDKALNLSAPGFADYIARLARAADMPIKSAEDVLSALEKRIDFFHACGARLSDHGLETVPDGKEDMQKANAAFACALRGEKVPRKERDCYRFTLLAMLGRMYARRGWAQQYHIGALRNNNSRMLAAAGPDTGFDSMDDRPFAKALSSLLDAQDRRAALPRTILYCINPAENYVIGSMIGNFQQSGIPGKVQMGAAWWFQDQRDGMTEQLKALANLGLLGRFVGMLTDSRSFISYPRHEYFRRILCDTLGRWVENGELPNDVEWLKALARGISYENARQYFNM